MVSLAIFLEIREFFKTGHPLTNIINAKFNTLVVRSKQVLVNLFKNKQLLDEVFMNYHYQGSYKSVD